MAVPSQDDTALVNQTHPITKPKPATTAPGVNQPAAPIPLSGMGTPPPSDRAPVPASPAPATADPMAFTAAPAAPAAPVANPFDPANQPAPHPTFQNNDDLNQFWASKFQQAGMPGQVLTPNVAPSKMAPVNGGAGSVAQYDPAALEANQTALAAQGANNPAVQDLLRQSTSGQFADNTAKNTQSDAYNAQTAKADTLATNLGIQRAGGVFADTLPAGQSVGTPGFYDGLKNLDGSTPSGPVGPNTDTTPIPLPGNGPTPIDRSPSPNSPTDPMQAIVNQVAGGAAGGSTGSVGPNAGVGLTNTNPDDSLIGKTITPNNSVDRVKTFQDSLKSTIENVLDPAYKARERDTNRYNFGAGRGVSGMARTSQGDIASDYGHQIADLTNQGLTGATTGSIDDLYRNLGIAQQQQGFQKDLSDDAFNQNVTAAQLNDYLTNSEFGRGLAKENAGYANNPSDVSLILSKIFGDQSSAAGDAAAKLFASMGAKNGSAGGTGGISSDDILQFIQSLGGNKTPASGGYVDTPPATGGANV